MGSNSPSITSWWLARYVMSHVSEFFFESWNIRLYFLPNTYCDQICRHVPCPASSLHPGKKIHTKPWTKLKLIIDCWSSSNQPRSLLVRPLSPWLKNGLFRENLLKILRSSALKKNPTKLHFYDGGQAMAKNKTKSTFFFTLVPRVFR